MAPDIGHRIGAILRALEEVVTLAIDPTNKPAREQLALAVSFLMQISKQHDKAYHLAIAELRLYSRLLLQLEEAIGEVIEPDLYKRLKQADAQGLANLQAPHQRELEAVMRDMREIADAVVTSDAVGADPLTKERVQAIVIDHSIEETAIRRGWMATGGVEPDLSTLPSLDAIIASSICDLKRSKK